MTWYLAAVASIGALWLLMPRGMPGRLPAALLFLPLFIVLASGLAAGDFDLSLLDVGQGLAAVVRTAGHVLVYDTGQEVLLPYLRSQGLGAPDLVMVSHGDADHAGGLASLREAFPGVRVLTGAMDRIPDTKPCMRGQRWDWDGVHFEVLYPDMGDPLTGNDGSCVLRVSSEGGSLLLPGDIMKKGERRLLALEPVSLHSDVLVAPHHGSNSSSTPDFVAAVVPRLVLFPVGYRDRWGFPKSEVEASYLSMANLADTADDGALCVRFRAGVAPNWSCAGAGTRLVFGPSAKALLIDLKMPIQGIFKPLGATQVRASRVSTDLCVLNPMAATSLRRSYRIFRG